MRPSSFSEAIGYSTSKTLLDIRKEGGTKNLTSWILGRLIELFTYLGAFESVTDFQVQMLATRICSKFYYFTPKELDYFFVKFENGDYGVFYIGKCGINPQIIMKALIKYEEELQSKREEEKSKRALQEISRKQKEEKEKAVSWEEYCKQKGIENRVSPLGNIDKGMRIKYDDKWR